MTASHLRLGAGALALAVVISGSAFVAYRLLDSTLQPLATGRVGSLKAGVQDNAQRVIEWFDGAQNSVATVASSLEPWTPTTQQILGSRTHLDVATRSSTFDAAFVTDTTGRVVASDSGSAVLVGQNRNLAYIMQTMASGARVSGVYRDTTLRRGVVGVAAALHTSGGRATGAVVALTYMPGGSLATAITSIHSGADATTAVYLADDRVIQFTPLTIEPADANFRAPGRSDRRFMARYRGAGGIEMVAASAPVREGWTVVSVLRADDFYSPLRGPRLVMAVTLTVAGLILWFSIVALSLRWRRAAAQTEAAKRSFLAITGHELRTPLAVIRGFSQTLVKRWDGIEEAQRKDLGETIFRQSLNLEHLIERLLMGAQINLGILPSVSIRSRDLVPTITSAVEQAQSLSPLHTIEMDVPDVLEVETDHSVIGQVLGILLENAIRFSPEGGSVSVSAARRGKRIDITVEDEGVGLPSDTDAIFERFSQSESADSRVHEEGGVGLGLFIARARLRTVDASIRAERRDLRGARFVIRLGA